MTTPSRLLNLAAFLSVTLVTGIALQAQDNPTKSLRSPDSPPAGQRPAGDAPRAPREGFGFRGGGLGFDSLSQDEKDKLKAANEKARQDPKVEAARARMEAAAKEMRDAMHSALIAADPSVESILKKLEEAREKAMKERDPRPRGEAEQPPK